MNYTLNSGPGFKGPQGKRTLRSAFAKLAPVIGEGRTAIVQSLIAIMINSGAMLVAPIIVATAIDTAVRLRDPRSLLNYALLTLAIYMAGVVASYFQVVVMGGMGQRVLYNIRNSLFVKLQELPVAFFNQNKAGDLISRLNNDTDKLNQFVSQTLMQFMGTVVMMTGAAVFLLSLNLRLGFAALIPAIAVLLVTRATGAWVKKKNLRSLQALGGMSGEVQEGLQNFK